MEFISSMRRRSTTSSTHNSFMSKLGRSRVKSIKYGDTEISQPSTTAAADPVSSRENSISSCSSTRRLNSNSTAGTGPIVMEYLGCDVLIESGSPNLIGTPSQSAGAIISGQLRLRLNHSTGQCQVRRLRLVLRLTTKFQNPGVKGCKKCAESHQDLETWDLVSDVKKYSNGNHYFPWSVLLPGNSPATTCSTLGSVEYAFVVSVSADSETTTTDPVEFVEPVVVHRLVPPPPSQPYLSTVVTTFFPSSGLHATLKLPRVTSPFEKFNVSLSVTGVIQDGNQTRTLWRLLQLYWHVVEQTTAKPCLVCDQHGGRRDHEKEVKKKKEHSKSKTLGFGTISKGWTVDVKPPGGELFLDFDAFVAAANQSGKSKPVVPDVCTSSGLQVSHQLVLEFTFSESLITDPRSKRGGRVYGSGRLMRMSIDLPVFDVGCDEVGWDLEMPPEYVSDVMTPPRYDLEREVEELRVS